MGVSIPFWYDDGILWLVLGRRWVRVNQYDFGEIAI